MSAMDIPEPQVLAESPVLTGGALNRVHLILLRRVDQNSGKWLCLKPNGIIEVRDLNAVVIIPLVRNSLFLAGTDGDVGQFPYVLSEDDLVQHHARASQMSRLLGPAPIVADIARTSESWRVCHPGSLLFGEVVEDELVSSPSTGVVRGAMGLAFVDDHWWPAERVADRDYLTWMSSLRTGPGRDPRVAGNVRDGSGRRHCTLHGHLGMLRPVDRSKDKTYPHPGPSAAIELLSSVRSSNHELIAYDDYWSKNSGISQQSAIRCEHRSIFHALGLFQSWDQIDLPNTAGGEYLCRRAVQIQRAVRVNPRAPSFLGLHKMIEHALDESGGVSTKDFTAHFATVAEADARVLKQNRLFRQELGVGPVPGSVDDSDDAEAPPGPKKTRAERRAAAKVAAAAAGKAPKP